MFPITSTPDPADETDECNIPKLTRQLRQALEQTLDELIGTYTLPKGYVVEEIENQLVLRPSPKDVERRRIKAIATIKSVTGSSGDEMFPPSGTDVEGMEVVLFYPIEIPMQLLDGYRVELEWTVHLKLWDRSKSFYRVMNRLFEMNSLNIKQVLPIPPDKRLGIPEMRQILISSFLRIGS